MSNQDNEPAGVKGNRDWNLRPLLSMTGRDLVIPGLVPSVLSFVSLLFACFEMVSSDVSYFILSPENTHTHQQ